VRWFAASWLLPQEGRGSWDRVQAQDVQRWMVHLLGRYSSAYASIQFRALRQFFKWLAAEDGIPDPMARLRAQGGGAGSPSVHQRRTIGRGARLPRQHVRPAP
jgi:site-specific recombinase XerD